MSFSEAQRFVAAIASDPALAEAATAAVQGKSPAEAAQALSEFAKNAGYDFTLAETVPQPQSDPNANPLSEDALNQIAGGSNAPTSTPQIPAAGDDVSSMMAALFQSHGQLFQILSDQP